MKTQKLNISVKNEEMKVKVTSGVASLKASIIMLIISFLCIMFLLLMNVLQPDEERFRKMPEQIEYVEVVGKRTESSGGRRKIRTYVVSFKFADGSEKEFAVGTNGSHVYNALQKGVTGKFIYKEIESEDGARDFKSHRRFYSFKKDPEYGGETLKIPFSNTLEFTSLFYFVPWFFAIILFSILNIKTQMKFRKIPEQVVSVRVKRKRKDEGGKITNYFITFELPSGVKKVLLVGNDNSKAYDFVNKGDTGILTYKEYGNQLIYCCFKKDL